MTTWRTCAETSLSRHHAAYELRYRGGHLGYWCSQHLAEIARAHHHQEPLEILSVAEARARVS